MPTFVVKIGTPVRDAIIVSDTDVLEMIIRRHAGEGFSNRKLNLLSLTIKIKIQREIWMPRRMCLKTRSVDEHCLQVQCQRGVLICAPPPARAMLI